MSSWRGLDLFGSGPHRVSIEPRGFLVRATSFLLSSPSSPGSQPVGALELELLVRGRLVATTEAALWSLRDAVADEAEFPGPPTTGTLVDNFGRSFTGLTFIQYQEVGLERGRAWSMAYEARFRAFG